MRPAFIYLDLGNVVVFFDRERAFRQMAAASGADVGTVRDVVMHAGLQQALERGDIRWPEFHAEFSRRTGTRCDPDALARAASDMFWLNVGMLPLIAACERAGVPMGILSNTCDPHWRFLTSGTYAVLPGGFREIVLSHEVGAAKPERSIYDLATARAGVDPERIFFCDDLPPHVDAARAAGWDAECFESAHLLTEQLARRGLNLGL
jgi:glucose-1-phosphatase